MNALPDNNQKIYAYLTAGVVTYLILLICAMQMLSPLLMDTDSLYHTRYANLFFDQGMSRSFQWTQQSIWKDSFADKEFLFHVYLVPFCVNGNYLIFGGKLAVILLNIAILLSLLHILRKNRISFIPLWLFMFFSAGSYFLMRMAEVRPHLVSILLCLWGAHFILNNRHKTVFAIGFIFAWSYAAPQMLIIIAFLTALGGMIYNGKFESKCLWASILGVAAGMIINPYFPNNIFIWYIQNFHVLFYAWGFGDGGTLRLGGEFYPYNTREFVANAGMGIVMLATILIILISYKAPASYKGENRFSKKSVQVFIVMLISLVMFFYSPRFIEYFAPFVVLSLAFIVNDTAKSGALKAFLEKISTPNRRIILLITVILLFLMHLQTVFRFAYDASGRQTYGLEKSADWIKKNVPEGETIAHMYWGDFSQMFYFAPEYRYLNGLDQTFMFVYDRRKSDYVQNMMYNSRFHLDPFELRRMFNCDYLVVSKKNNLLYIKTRDSWIDPVYEDDDSVVYKL